MTRWSIFLTGFLTFIILFLFGVRSAIIFAFVTFLLNYIPTIGASGAIAGVMGAYFVLYPRSRVLTLIWLFVFVDIIEIPAVFFLGFWFLMQLFSGVGSVAQTAGNHGGVAFWAHVAGFLFGVAAVFVFRRSERQRVEWWHE